MKMKTILFPLFALLINAFFAFSPNMCFWQEQSSEKIEALAQDAKLSAPEAVLEDFRNGKLKMRVIVDLCKPSAFGRNQDIKDMKVSLKAGAGEGH